MVFDDIETRLLDELTNPSVQYVVATSPWFSNATIWKALARLRGASVLTIREKHHRSKKRIDEMNAITPLVGYDRVRYLQTGAGRSKSILHQKFFVFLDHNFRPISVAFGSWNASGGGGSNIELFSFVADERVASAFVTEFKRTYHVSKRLCP